MEKDIKKPFVEVAFGRPCDRKPVWFLRQAGRYLPEYREIRKNMSFTDLCKHPVKAAEVTLQPLKRFDLDAAIIFSDILIPPIGMGQDLSFDGGHGPILTPPVRSAADLSKLKISGAADSLGYVGDAIQETKKGLTPEQTMIGFAGAPFTVASYMIEGQGSKVYTEVKKLIFNEPETFRGLLQGLTEVSIDYLKMQVSAGADALMLFDTWVGNLTVDHYAEFIKPCMTELFSAIKSAHPEIPVVYYPGQGSEIYPQLSGFNIDVVAVDWRVSIDRAIRKLADLGVDASVQGNLDPQTFLASDDVLRQEVAKVIERAKGSRGHIFNVGHGLLPHLSPDKLTVAIDEIRRH